jgi:hypothetical protein
MQAEIWGVAIFDLFWPDFKKSIKKFATATGVIFYYEERKYAYHNENDEWQRSSCQRCL